MRIAASPSERPRRYLDLARAYAEVAGRLDDGQRPGETTAPLYMLVAHGLELALKAAIARGDGDDEHLMWLGHDLPLCLRVAAEDGLDLTNGGDIESVVAALAMPHLAQVLRYPAHLSWPLPALGLAREALAALLFRVEAFITD